MREYLAYKLYNIVSDNSFRVRLLKIRYIDTGTRGLVLEKYAFAIEPMNILMARTSSVEIEEEKIIEYSIDPEAAVRLALFQFLIGNNDYFIPMGHNIKAIDILSDSGEMLTPLPYDFDYSGMVDTYYANTKGTDLKEKGIERIYSGPCLKESEFEDVLDDFAGYKDQFISEIRDFEYLNRRNRVDLERYIKSFYDLYRKEVLLRILLENCIDTEQN